MYLGVGWYIQNILCDDPIPLADGCKSAFPHSVIAVIGDRNAMWLAKIVSIIDDESFSVHWFHQVGNKRVYTLVEDVEDPVHRNTVVCSGVPMQSIKKGTTITWELNVPLEVLSFLSSTDSGITNM